MLELFKLLGTIAVDNKEAVDALNETGESGNKAHTKLSGAFNKMGSAAKVCGKAMAAGLAAGATAMAGLVGKAIGAAGELEQNMGGSEAVFKEHAAGMQEAANQAFSKMGLSASEFLGTANKMGALFQGAGFEISESADMSSKAMQRAADVASIMGIDVNAAMEAVAGMAKGNFTMMDNLGVAINDTTLAIYAQENGLGKLETTQDKVNAAYMMFMERSEYAAGNYARENETLAGAMNTAKAAISNFLAGTGTVEDLASSFKNAGRVIAKNLKQILPNLVAGLKELIEALTPEIPPILQELLPALIEGAVALVAGLVQMIPQILGILANAVISLFDEIFNTIGARVQGTGTIFESVFLSIRGMWENVLKPVLQGIITFITGVFTGNWKKAWEGVVGILKGIVNSIIGAIETMINSAINAINSIIEGVNSLLPIGAIAQALGFEGDGIPTIKNVKFPRLEKGGILEKGQIGLLEGNGAEAVVPLEKNRAWIGAVAKDMQSAFGTNGAVPSAGYSVENILLSIERMIDSQTDSLIKALSDLQESGTIKVEDPTKLFKLVRKEQRKFRYATGEGGL